MIFDFLVLSQDSGNFRWWLVQVVNLEYKFVNLGEFIFCSSAALGHSVNAVNTQAGKFFNRIGDLFQGGMTGENNNLLQYTNNNAT